MAKMPERGGQYRRMLLEKRGEWREEEQPVSFFYIRFYICLFLFIGYMVLDYTGTSIYQYDSEKILAEIRSDMTENFDLEAAAEDMMSSIWISE